MNNLFATAAFLLVSFVCFGNSPTLNDALLGKWNYSVDAMGQAIGGSFVVSKDGDAVKVVISSDQSGDDLDTSDVKVEDNKLSFSFSAEVGQTITVTFDLVFEDKKFKGDAIADAFGTFPVTGEKAED